MRIFGWERRYEVTFTPDPYTGDGDLVCTGHNVTAIRFIRGHFTMWQERLEAEPPTDPKDLEQLDRLRTMTVTTRAFWRKPERQGKRP